MTVLHVVTDDSYPRTVCGVKLERGVHRTGRDWLAAHTERPDIEPCPTCQGDTE